MSLRLAFARETPFSAVRIAETEILNGLCAVGRAQVAVWCGRARRGRRVARTRRPRYERRFPREYNSETGIRGLSRYDVVRAWSFASRHPVALCAALSTAAVAVLRCGLGSTALDAKTATRLYSLTAGKLLQRLLGPSTKPSVRSHLLRRSHVEVSEWLITGVLGFREVRWRVFQGYSPQDARAPEG